MHQSEHVACLLKVIRQVKRISACTKSTVLKIAKPSFKLEACFDDERQFKTAKRPQGDATIRKRFFGDNFVIVRRRSKRIAALESAIFSTCVCMQIFNFCDCHVTTFRHPSGALYLPNAWSQTLQTSKSTPLESRLSIGTIGLGVKLFPVGCAQDSRRAP